MNHFKGKKVLEHLVDARKKGAIAASEIHGTELPGHISAAADAAKESAYIILLICILIAPNAHRFMLIFIAGWLIWKVGRSAILGWARLERMHRLIDEERYEIEHQRPQEKEELRALYAAKGFSGKLLDEAVEVLMADDNRLLQVMLEEELGLHLETHEHPLKQASGAFLGVVGASLVLSFGLFFLPPWGAFASGAFVIALSAGTTAQLEKNNPLPAIIWNLATATLALATAYFLTKIL